MEPPSQQSEPTAIGALPMAKRLMQQIQARKDWEREYPDIAAAWNEALREDHERTTKLEREQRLGNGREAASEALRRIGFPLDVIEGLRTPRHEPPLKAALEFMSKPPKLARFLVLLGTVGTGKTFAAAWCAREVLAFSRVVDNPSGGEVRRGEPVMFCRASTIARMQAYGDADREWFEQLCGCTLLVLDDLGAEPLGQVGAALLDELLDRRFASHRRTVITSNLDAKLLAERYGARITDRLKQATVKCQSTGPSMRGRG